MKLRRVRREKNNNFTTIDNTILRDKTITLKSKGLLLTVMGLPETWDFSVAGIVTVLKENGRAIYSAIKELRAAGYVEVSREYDNGKISAWVYTFHETPMLLSQNLLLQNLHVENLHVEKSTQYNKQRIKETKNQVNISLTIAEAFPNTHPYPMKELIDAFPEITFGPGQCGAVEKEVKDTPTDREAWKQTIDKYKIEFNPELNRYWPNKITNLLSVFKDFRLQLERQQNAQPIVNQKRNNVRDTESTLRYLNATPKI